MAVVLAGAGLAGCGGSPAASPPEGYKVIRHPSAEVAVPDDWDQLEERELDEADPEAVELQVPDVPEDARLGLDL